MSEVVDLVVAGGGPAGLATAIEAGRAGMDVLVLDPHDGVIDKACGEGILPGGVEALEALGVEPVGFPFVGIRYADAKNPSLRALGRFPEGTGLGVRRTVLHAALRERAGAVADIRRDRVITFEQNVDGVLVNGNILARSLVAADGLHSRIRRTLGVGRLAHRPRRFGLRRHYTVQPWSDRVEVYFGDQAEAYVTPVDQDLVGVALLFEARAAEEGATQRFERLLSGFPLLLERLAAAKVASRVRGDGPFEQRVARRVVGNVLLVGDAAGYVDPLMGEGIGLAFATASAAVRCLVMGKPGAYEREWTRLTRRPFVLTSALLSITRRRRLHEPMIRLAQARPAVFDAALGMVARHASA